DIDIQSKVEEMLVIRSLDVWRHQVTIASLLFVDLMGPGCAIRRSVLHQARQEHFQLKTTVLTKNPVKPIIIVIHGGEPGEHQLLSRTGFMPAFPLYVSPEHASVPLVERDGMRLHDWFTAEIMSHPRETHCVFRGVGQWAQRAHSVVSQSQLALVKRHP